MKQRNPEARCGNCPYFAQGSKGSKFGNCLRFPPCLVNSTGLVMPERVCGEHPDFFKETAE